MGRILKPSTEGIRPLTISDELIMRAACRFGRNRNQFAIALKVVCQELRLIQFGCTLKDYIEYMSRLGIVKSQSAIPDCSNYSSFLQYGRVSPSAEKSGKLSPKVQENLILIKNTLYDFIKANLLEDE